MQGGRGPTLHIPLPDEANAHTLLLLLIWETQFLRNFSHSSLRQTTHRKEHSRENGTTYLAQEVALVFRCICAS